MLQLEGPGRRATKDLGREVAGDGWESMEELSALVDRRLEQWLDLRNRAAGKGGAVSRLVSLADRVARTDAVEFLDRPDYPAKKKVRIVHALHRMNQVFLHYHRFLYHLKPMILEVNRKEGRPARLVELASGSGEFTLALARLAFLQKLPVEITGSDYIPEYVTRGNEKAARRNLPVRFVELNAFDMKGIKPGDCDIFFICQSIHHFSPGQMAMMIAQAERAGARYFVAIDGYRSFLILFGLPALAGASVRFPYFHDALISARRLYTHEELTLIARMAAPKARVDISRSWPTHSVLAVEFTS